METSDWWVGQPPMKDVWRFAGIGSGALCVMTSGLCLMQQLPADSWDSLQLVKICVLAIKILADVVILWL